MKDISYNYVPAAQSLQALKKGMIIVWNTD